MVPFSVSDILKLLDEWPVWKALRDSPKRIAELERRVAELEKGRALPAPLTGRECPLCGGEMKVLAEHEHRQFGFAGQKVHEMQCPHCQNKTSRNFMPGKGYS